MSIIDRRYSVAEGQAIKSPCKVATTANITLSGAQTIDGVAVTGTSPPTRVLVKDQTDQTLNGIYDVSTGNWTRTKDFDGAFDVLKGTAVYVTDGTVNTRHTYLVTTAGSVVIGTSLITFEQDRSSEAAASAVSAAASAATASSYAALLAAAVALNNGSGAVLMYPPKNQLTGAWTVLDPYGVAVSTAGTTTDGLQEAITYSVNNGFPLRVLGHGGTTVSQQTGTLNSSTTITGLSTAAITAALANGTVYVTGPGIPSFTTVSSVDSSSQIHISQAATSSGAVTLRFAQNLIFLSCTTGIQLPPAEQWSAVFQDVNITFSSAVTGPCFSIDSCMIVDISFVGGQLVGTPSGPSGAAYLIYFNPTNPVPIDGITTITASRFFFSNLAFPASGGFAQAVVGFNCSSGINNNFFGFCEINGTGSGATPNTHYGIEVFGQTGSTGFEQNIVEAAVIHIVKDSGVQIGTTTVNASTLRQNIWRIGAIKAGAGADGFNTYGSSDIIHIGGITAEEGAFARGVVLESSASANHATVGQIIGNSGATLVETNPTSNYCYGALRGVVNYGATKGHTYLPDGTLLQYINNAGSSTVGVTTNFDIAFPNSLLMCVGSPNSTIAKSAITSSTTGCTITVDAGTPTFHVWALGR